MNDSRNNTRFTRGPENKCYHCGTVVDPTLHYSIEGFCPRRQPDDPCFDREKSYQLRRQMVAGEIQRMQWARAKKIKESKQKGARN